MRTYPRFVAITLAALAALASVAGCASDPAVDDDLIADDSDGKADGTPNVSDDSLNGLWTATVDGKSVPDAVIASWPAAGIQLQLGAASYALVRNGDALAATDVTLTIAPNDFTVYDDAIQGTVAGKVVTLARDTAPKDPITVALPGDRPYRAYLTDLLAPAAQRDRESYAVMHSTQLRTFLKSCELYKSGSWQRKYMKGATFAEQSASFGKIISAVDNLKATPHTLIRSKRFSQAVTDALKDPTQAGLALSTFAMYFSTAAGRAVRIPIASDATAYFITDRPARAEKIGLVVMKTGLHGPLASTFGRQLLDMGAMPSADDTIYARTMMELLAKSDVHRAATLSKTGRSALTDWFAVMAIEDYRGIAFGFPGLGWGLNMTNVQFYGLVARALARPGQVDGAGKPIVAQVIVGNELRPGDPSYADVLNGGNDMQEYEDMSRLKVLATSYLRQAHPDKVAAVEAAFAGIVPAAELDSRDQADLFRFITAQLYDTQGRTLKLTGAKADAAIDAVTALLATLAQDSAAFEAYVLANGVTKSNVAAPKSTGF